MSARRTADFVPVEGAHDQVLKPLRADLQSCGVLVIQLAPMPALVATADAPMCEKRSDAKADAMRESTALQPGRLAP